MALDEQAVLTAAKGYIFTAPEGTTPPDPSAIDMFTPGTQLTGWDSVGHTSRDELPQFGYEGGETETRGSWQNSALRTVVTEAPIDYVTMNLLEFSEQSLELYYATQNANWAKPGEFIVGSGGLSSVRRAILIIVVDGDTHLAFYAPKTDVRRDDSIELETDEFAMLPIRATLLEYTHQSSGNHEIFRWISSDTGVNPQGSS